MSKGVQNASRRNKRKLFILELERGLVETYTVAMEEKRCGGDVRSQIFRPLQIDYHPRQKQPNLIVSDCLPFVRSNEIDSFLYFSARGLLFYPPSRVALALCDLNKQTERLYHA